MAQPLYVDWGRDAELPPIERRDWKYKTHTIPIQVDPKLTQQLVYGEWPMRKRKYNRKKHKPTKREKELEAQLDSLHQYNGNRERSWEQSFKEKNAEITRLKDWVSDLAADKRFLQQTIQHLVPKG